MTQVSMIYFLLIYYENCKGRAWQKRCEFLNKIIKMYTGERLYRTVHLTC